jgi:predicted PurR-regulated permease PerM
MVGVDVPPTIDQLFAQLNPTRYLSDVAKGLQGFASNAVFVLIYLGFILASRRGFERKIVGLFPQREERQESIEAFIRIRDGVEQYLWVQTVTGLMIAVGSWIVMAVVGLDNAVFWAFLIFIASYIPVVGGLVGVLAPPIFALVEFDGFWPAIILLAVLQTIQFVVGNVVQPRMQGRSLNMDPVAVLLALAFWGKVWGLAGMFLSTPLTVMTMVILAQFEGSRWVAVLLSADGEPDRLKTQEPGTPPDVPAPTTKAAPRRTPRTKKS